MFDNRKITEEDMFENTSVVNKFESNDTAGEAEAWSMEDFIFWYCHLLIIPCIAVMGLVGNYLSTYKI